MITNSIDPGTDAVASRVIGGQRTGVWSGWRELPRPERRRVAGALGYVAIITLVFVQPLAGLTAHALESSLHSHIPLVPVIAGYLLYTQPRRRGAAYQTSFGGASILAAVGIAALALAIGWRGQLSVNDHLAAMTLAYVSLIAAGGFLFLGSAWMSDAVFPIAFLMFMIPMPDRAVYWLEMASASASADAAAVLFSLSGTPVLRDGMFFTLPGIVLEVAKECSGIRSSWVLFITSVLASRLFLQNPWRRLVLVVFVIPLGIVRNAFRILVIGLLCVHIGPHMIDSVIHHRGGPLFFGLSLIPLFLLLWWLWRQEHQRKLRG